MAPLLIVLLRFLSASSSLRVFTQALHPQVNVKAAYVLMVDKLWGA